MVGCPVGSGVWAVSYQARTVALTLYVGTDCSWIFFSLQFPPPLSDRPYNFKGVYFPSEFEHSPFAHKQKSDYLLFYINNLYKKYKLFI